MRRFLAGFLVGILLCVSLFEVIHKTVEIEAESYPPLCSIIYDKLNQAWEPRILYQLKLTYKFFAWPVRTVWVMLDDQDAHIGVMAQEEDEWTVHVFKAVWNAIKHSLGFRA